MAEDLFRHTRPFNQLDGFYTEWSEHLTKDCLPPLRYFPTDAKNDAVLDDIRSYYDTLNHYANKDTILYFLFPSWRSNSLETSILFLGDIDPRLLTSLIQSFIDDDKLVRTFSNLVLSPELENNINETVSGLEGEMRGAQNGFIRRFSEKWVSSFLGSLRGTVLMETATSVTTDEDGAAIMDEFVRIFREANQLRKDTIANIVGVLNTYQKAMFLESVCKFLAGFKHQDKAFENSLLGYNLINQQLPRPDELHQPSDPSGEVNARRNYPRPMMQQQQYALQFPPDANQLFHPFAPSGLVMAHQNHHPHMMPHYAAQRPPYGHQLFPPFAPSGLVMVHQNHHSHMMPHYAAQRPPYGHQLFPPFAPSGLVMAHQSFRPPMMQQYAPQRPPHPPMNQHHQQHPPDQDHVIYVGNLAPEATNDLLLQRFSHYRSVGVAKICFDYRSGDTYGFVSFEDESEKWHAMEAMNRQILLDRPMFINLAAKNTI